MNIDLQALNSELDLRPWGLILLSARAGDEVRRALWDVLGSSESLYWLGPLAEKPVVNKQARCWLLECPLEERLSGLGTILRRDPHAIHAIGPVDGPLFEALVRGALTGHITVAELEADDHDGLLAAAARFDLPEELRRTALHAAIDVNGALRLLGR